MQHQVDRYCQALLLLKKSVHLWMKEEKRQQSFGALLEDLREENGCFLISRQVTGVCTCMGREVVRHIYEVMENYNYEKQRESWPDFCILGFSKTPCSSSASQNTQVPTCKPITVAALVCLPVHWKDIITWKEKSWLSNTSLSNIQGAWSISCLPVTASCLARVCGTRSFTAS